MTMTSIPDQASDLSTIVDEFPLTSIQRQIWFMATMNSDDPSLNIAIRWEMRGALQERHLEAAFRHVIARHEILRTRFVDNDGTPAQEVLADAAFRLGVVDIRAVAEDRHAARLDEIATEDARAPFDLLHPPLIRATFVRQAPDRGTILITAHHIVFDGHSIGVLGREVGEIAAALAEGREPALAPLPLHYGDFALWQEEYLASGVVADDAAYWTQTIRGASYFEVPPDNPRPAIRDSSVARCHLDLPADFDARLKSTSRALGLSPFAFGAAVASAVLAEAAGTTEVSFGTPILGRDEADLDGLIGPFISQQVLRLSTDMNDNFAHHATRTRDAVEGAIAHQALPFADLVRIANPVRDPARPPLVSVGFNLLPVFMQDRDFGPFQLISRASHTPGAALDLTISIIGRPDGWRLNLEYASTLYTPARMNRLMAALARGLDVTLSDPGAKLADLASPAIEDETDTQVKTGADTSGMAEPASGDIASHLSTIWADILSLDTVPSDGDFFALGGHSLLAVRLLTRIRSTWKVTIGVAALYQASTLAEQVRLIEATLTPAIPPIIDDWRVEPVIDGPGPRIITINDVGLILSAARHMGNTPKATCIRLFDGTRGLGREAMDFDEIASAYVDVLKQVQPQGPYILFGVCVHGNIAIEVGRQLKAAGEDVRVIIKDVWEPGYVAEIRANPVNRLRDRLFGLRNRWRLVRSGLLSLPAMLGSYRLVRATGILQAAVRLGLIDRIRSTDLEAEQERFLEFITEARNAHRPGMLDFPVLHMVTSITPKGRWMLPSIGWERVVKRSLKTIRLGYVGVHRGRETGGAEMAATIERFLDGA
jgi:hypothetical protein